METLRHQILTEGLCWEGTPFLRGQMLCGVAGDCCCILWRAYQQHVGIVPWEPYARPPAPYEALFSGQWERHTQRELLLEALRLYMPALREIAPDEAHPGDFLTTGRPGEPSNHVALLLTPELLLHARLDPSLRTYGARLMRERRHAALRKTERTAFTFVGDEPHGGS